MKDNNITPITQAIKEEPKYEGRELINPKEVIKRMATNYLKAIKAADTKTISIHDKTEDLYDMAEYVANLCEAMRVYSNLVQLVVYENGGIDHLKPVIDFLSDMESTIAYSQVGYVKLAETYTPPDRNYHD